MWPGDVDVGIVDVHDPPVQGPFSDQAAGDLNLGKLWHPPVLLPCRSAPTARQVMTRIFRGYAGLRRDSILGPAALSAPALPGLTAAANVATAGTGGGRSR